MKNKFIILIIIVGLIFITSCNSENKNDEIEIKYTEQDLINISLTIQELDITINLSDNSHLKEILKSLKLVKNNVNQESKNEKYILTFSTYEFTIYDNGNISYIDNVTKYEDLKDLNSDFNYLDDLLSGNMLDFSNILNDQNIQVFNTNNDSGNITDKLNFLNNLNEIKYFKLQNPSHYQIGNLKYKIQIDEEIINVYDNYIVMNDNLYIIVEGDFSFLNNIKFSTSSGWLPWV